MNKQNPITIDSLQHKIEKVTALIQTTLTVEQLRQLMDVIKEFRKLKHEHRFSSDESHSGIERHIINMGGLFVIK